MNNKNAIVIVVLIVLIGFVVYSYYGDDDSFGDVSYLLNKKCIDDCVALECKLDSEVDYCSDGAFELVTMICNDHCKNK